jgi:aldehyde dehydrogenase (NAD+)
MTDRLMYRQEFYIDGKWAPPAGDERLDVVSPSTEEVVGQVPVALDEDIDRAVAAARRAFDQGPWPRMSPGERAEVLDAVAEVLHKRAPDLVGVQVDEMGIPVMSAIAQSSLLAPVFEYYADLARTYEFERHAQAGSAAAVVLREPVGVVGAITPWNGPTVLSTWKIAPSLAAGCTVVLKPPPESPLSPLVLAEILDEAGVPAGVVNVVPGGREVGQHLVTHRGTDKIAFTGSTAAGKRIMSLCGELVKRVSLELGGKSATIILGDTDMASVVPRLVRGAMHNAGQVCAMQSRVLVERSRYDEAVELAADTVSQVKVGDPHEFDTVVGPLVAERQRDRVEGYIRLGIEAGARLVAGGQRPAHLPKGWYVSPTVLGDVDNGMRVAREEIFGPVLSFIPFEDDEDAVAIANDSPYGLAGGVWSRDHDRAFALARRVRTGSVSVNGGMAPQPLVPFGGFKESGLGRELGPEGLESFLEPKTISYPPSAPQ